MNQPYVPTQTGHWVSEDFMRLSEVIKDYDESLDLRFIPAENRTTQHERENPYAVVETHVDGDRILFHAGPLSSPEEILARLFTGDNKWGDVLERLDATDRAREALKMKEQMDAEEERKDLIAFMVGSDKHYMKIKDPQGNLIKLDDERRRVQ